MRVLYIDLARLSRDRNERPTYHNGFQAMNGADVSGVRMSLGASKGGGLPQSRLTA